MGQCGRCPDGDLLRDQAGTKDDLVHWMCCVDLDMPLCRVGDVSDGDAGDDEPVNCVVCLAESETARCPLGMSCPEAEA